MQLQKNFEIIYFQIQFNLASRREMKILKKQVIALIILIGFLQIIHTQSFYFHQKAFYIPHPEKAHRGGQDAHFSSDQLLIVADGVGGWNSQGIDPSKYSRFLCSRASQLFSFNKQLYKKDPIELIAHTSQQNTNQGSSTMVVLTLNDDNILKTCYIGDSGFMIIRQTEGQLKIIYESEQQQHSFNFPFQLGYAQNGDDPYSSICKDFQVQQNDILIVGSDGLFDNLYSEEMLELVKNTSNEDELFGLTEILAKQAIKRGNNKNFLSPFAKKAKQLKLSFMGGKLDDTTVIISKIKKGQVKNISDIDEAIIKIKQNQMQNSQQSVQQISIGEPVL